MVLARGTRAPFERGTFLAEESRMNLDSRDLLTRELSLLPGRPPEKATGANEAKMRSLALLHPEGRQGASWRVRQ